MSEVVLGDVAQVVDCEHKTAPEAERGSAFAFSVGTPALRGSGIDFSQAKPVDEATYRAWSRRAEPKSGDLILAREAPVGGVGLVDGARKVCLGQRTVLVRPDMASIDSRYLFYLLRSPGPQDWMEKHSEGSTVKHLNVADIRRVALGVLPPMDQQRRIAGVLGALDDLIEVNRGLIADLESLANALYRKVIAGLHSSITSRSLASTVHVISGGTPKTTESSYWGGSIPWFSVVDTPNGSESWVVRTEKTITDLGLSNCAAKILPIGSTIVTARGTVGNTALVGVPMAMNQSCYALSCRSGGKGYFNFYRIRSAVEELKRVSHGSVFSTITRDTLESVMVPGVRDEVVRQFDAEVDPLFQQLRGLIDENGELADTRDELLPLLMSGRVRVTEEVAA